MSECSCDYSYTCNVCQAKIDIENAMDYTNEIHDWTVESIRLIAKALNVEIPSPPKKRKW